MCQIRFNLNSSSTITTAQGKYKLVDSSSWISFLIDVNNPKTPDIVTTGDYELQVRIQDINGLLSDWITDTFKISKNCNDTISNVAPNADAGFDQKTSGTGVLLNGINSSDTDGTITNYSWRQLSGPSATITNSNQAQTAVSFLSEGIYVFELTVMDNDGATDTDTVQITKKPKNDSGDGTCNCDPSKDCCKPCTTGSGFEFGPPCI